MKRNYANKLISASEVIYNIGDMGTIVPTTESQTRPLTSLEPEVQREAWAQVVSENEPGTITAKKGAIDQAPLSVCSVILFAMLP